MRIADRFLGALVAVMALGCFWEAQRIWTGWRGPGTMLLVIGVIFSLLAVSYGFSSKRNSAAISWPDRPALIAIGVIGTSFAVYIAVMPWVGFTLSTWIFLTIVSKSASPSARTSSVLLVMGLVTALSYLVFRGVLDTPLPPGILGF